MSATILPRADSEWRSPRARTRGLRRFVWPAIVLAAVGGGGYFAWKKGWIPHPGARQEAPREARPVPVTLATAEARDVPVLATGLGRVEGFNTVTIRARVDGAIQRVAFTEGQDVREGDLLFQIDPAPYVARLAAARAQRAKDEALLANARRDLERYNELARQQVAARQQVDTQTAQVAQYEAAIQADQAEIDYAATQAGYTAITAPISGRLGARLVDAGNLVQSAGATPLVVIEQIRPITVTFSIGQDALPDVQRAIAASREPLRVEVYGRDPGRALATGRLTLVNNAVDEATGTVQLKAAFDNDDLALWPGGTVTARLRLSVRQGAVTAPEAAVQRGPDGPYVYVVGEGNTAEMRRVRLAFSRDGTTVFEDGLRAGERVVVDGAFKLKPDAPVRESDPRREREEGGGTRRQEGRS